MLLSFRANYPAFTGMERWKPRGFGRVDAVGLSRIAPAGFALFAERAFKPYFANDGFDSRDISEIARKRPNPMAKPQSFFCDCFNGNAANFG